MGTRKLLFKQFGQFASRLFYLILFTSFSIGIILMVINMIGLIIPLRNPGIYSYYGDDRKDANYTYQETMAQIDRIPDEGDEEYVRRLTELISNSISPYWYDEGLNTYHLRIPIWENYILWAYYYIEPERYSHYEFTDYRKAIERGIGLCSQYAIVASQIMELNGIESSVLALNGHVLTMALIDGEWHIVDPEYNVVIPHTLEEVENDGAIVKDYYEDTWAPEFVVDLFTTPENNLVFENAIGYKGTTAAEFERWAYTVIWIIPLYLMAPFILLKGMIIIVKKSKRVKPAIQNDELISETQIKED